ncbi:MAG: thiamine phosphate synthase, partial [Salibacteraceae bacterium]
MEVIVITSPTHRENEVQRIVHLFENGLQTLHLRKPKWKSSELETLIKDIPEMFHNRIIIHGHYKLALKYKLKGIHLHRKHRSNKWKNRWKRFLLKMRSPNLVITTTFNSLESLRENTQHFDYVFLGSVFNSHSYYSRDEEAGMNMLKSIVKKSPSIV